MKPLKPPMSDDNRLPGWLAVTAAAGFIVDLVLLIAVIWAIVQLVQWVTSK